MRHRYAIPVCLVPALLIAVAFTGCPEPVQRNVPEPSGSTTTPPWSTPGAPPSTTTPSWSTRSRFEPTVEDNVPTSEPESQALTLVMIDLDLPAPAFRGTPVPMEVSNVEKPLGKPRPPFFAPEGTVNLSRGKPVYGSDPAPVAGEYDYVTDGDKEASDFGYVELRPGSQWIQIDLGQESTIFGILVWHSHAEARVYNDVIIQVSNDPDFLDAKTVFNNDHDNSSGQGIGTEMGYVETSEGKLIECKGVEARYVRLFCRGSHIDAKNHYTEVEVLGIPGV